MERALKVCLRDSLKRHGLSMRKQGLQAALACLEASAVGREEESFEDMADALVEVIEDEGVNSCVVEEHTINAAVKRFAARHGGGLAPAAEGDGPAEVAEERRPLSQSHGSVCAA